jgi:Raf kinase inhibitor-like YbhB/YbcL family protein
MGSSLSNGTLQGTNDFGRVGYGGPSPPRGAPHHYLFRLFALDRVLPLKPRAIRPELLSAVADHKVGECQLVGIYGRS